MLAQCKAMTAEVHADAVALKARAEEHFRGIVDLVTMKALVWDDESLGARWREDEIPADMKDDVDAAREKLLEEQAAKLDAMGSKGGVTEETKRAIRESLGIA